MYFLALHLFYKLTTVAFTDFLVVLPDENTTTTFANDIENLESRVEVTDVIDGHNELDMPKVTNAVFELLVAGLAHEILVRNTQAWVQDAIRTWLPAW